MILNNSGKRMVSVTLALAIMLSLTSCEGMSRRSRNTAIGAGAGAVGGAILTNGSGLGTVGGAAVGGIIGHEVR